VTVLLHDLPEPAGHRPGSIGHEILRNHETAESLAALLEHTRPFLPGLTGLDIGTKDWPDRLDGRRVLNYTYGFGLLTSSVHPTLVLEAIGADYVGARPDGLFLSANKPHMAELMAALGFHVPRHRLVPGPLTADAARRICAELAPAGHLVLKPAYEESSIGLALLPNEPGAVRAAVAALRDRLPCVAMLQEYVPGQDVTVPVIGRSAPRCLPAVVLERDAGESGPFVFDAESKATKATVHYVPTTGWEPEVTGTLYAMALAATAAAGLRDYSRLDCRVAPDGRCTFIEINANPQLGLGKASFAVSAAVAGVPVGRVIQAVVEDDAAAIPGTVAG
jgi:D-alanine-D-alanine ligase